MENFLLFLLLMLTNYEVIEGSIVARRLLEGEETDDEADKARKKTKRNAKKCQAAIKNAQKVLELLKSREDLLDEMRFEHNERIREFFLRRGAIQSIPQSIIILLMRSMDFVLDSILQHTEHFDLDLTDDLKDFIHRRSEARHAMIELVFEREDLVPRRWGGDGQFSGKSRKEATTSTEGGAQHWLTL